MDWKCHGCSSWSCPQSISDTAASLQIFWSSKGHSADSTIRQDWVWGKTGASDILFIWTKGESRRLCLKRASLGIGFGRKQFLKYVGNYAKKYEVTFKNGHPSLKWWHGFKARHTRLCLRQPEGTAATWHLSWYFCTFVYLLCIQITVIQTVPCLVS